MGLRKDAHGFKAQGTGAHVIFSKIIGGGGSGEGGGSTYCLNVKDEYILFVFYFIFLISPGGSGSYF
jgi:hypothetical protein